MKKVHKSFLNAWRAEKNGENGAVIRFLRHDEKEWRRQLKKMLARMRMIDRELKKRGLD